MSSSFRSGLLLENFFAIMYTSRYIRYFLSTPGQWPPSLIFIIPRRRTVFSLVSPYCLTPKTWYSRWNLVAIVYTSRDPPYFKSTSGQWPPFWNSPSIFISRYHCNERQLWSPEKHKIDHCIICHWSFTPVDMMTPFSFRNYIKKSSTDICSIGRHKVTTGNLLMGEPPKCADWVPRGIGRSA